MNDTFTTEQRVKLEGYLANHTLPAGLGSKKSACSIAAINLAITGKLTDKIPDCMSRVLGRATIVLQDAMSYKARNSARYKRLLPDMAGTGRAKEEERLAVFMDWLWSTVLPQLQPLADEKGFGAEWSSMCRLKTSAAAFKAERAACAAYDNAGVVTYPIANAAATAAYAAAADRCQTTAASYAAAESAYAAAGEAAAAAAYAAHAVRAYAPYAAYEAASNKFWNCVDPIDVLERMTYLKGDKG